MKKIISIIILIIFLGCPLIVNAAGSFTLTPSTIKVGVGKEATINAKAVNAVGIAKVTSQDESIVKVTTTDGMVELNTEGSKPTGTIKIKGIKEGTAKLTVQIAAASYDSPEPIDLNATQEITVIVEEKGNPSTGVSLTAALLTITALAGAAYVIRKNRTTRFFG